MFHNSKIQNKRTYQRKEYDPNASFVPHQIECLTYDNCAPDAYLPDTQSKQDICEFCW